MNSDTSIEVERYLSRMRTAKDLSAELDVSRNYLTAMKAHGFAMPGGKASLRMARTFLEKSESFAVVSERPTPAG
jgi:hypothetical protein